jgi:hypothetical protein
MNCKKPNPAQQPTCPSALCHRWYVLRRRIMYPEPNPAQPAKRLSARTLGVFKVIIYSGGRVLRPDTVFQLKGGEDEKVS